MRKKYTIGNKQYYKLYAVTPAIGYTYQEIYHSMDSFAELFGVRSFAGSVLIPIDIAETLMAETPGYVPADKFRKRGALVPAKDSSGEAQKIVLGVPFVKNL